jgi:hypothetical protein
VHAALASNIWGAYVLGKDAQERKDAFGNLGSVLLHCEVSVGEAISLATHSSSPLLRHTDIDTHGHLLLRCQPLL